MDCKRQAMRVMRSNDRDAGWPLDEFHFISVRRIDENNQAARRLGGGTVGDSYAMLVQTRDRVVQTLDLKGEVNEIFLNFHGTAWRKTAQLDQFFAVWHAQEREMRTTGGRFPLQHLQAQHAGIKSDGLVHIAHPHAGVEKFLDFHLLNDVKRLVRAILRRR